MGWLTDFDLVRIVDEAVSATMDRIQADIPGRIERGQRPSGGPQKPNTPRVARAKQKKLGHSTPLLGKDRILSDAARWRKQRRGLGDYTLSPPDERVSIIPHLDALGYELGIPADAPKWLQDELRKRLRKR